jgi:hypothetical protein
MGNLLEYFDGLETILISMECDKKSAFFVKNVFSHRIPHGVHEEIVKNNRRAKVNAS